MHPYCWLSIAVCASALVESTTTTNTARNIVGLQKCQEDLGCQGLGRAELVHSIDKMKR